VTSDDADNLPLENIREGVSWGRPGSPETWSSSGSTIFSGKYGGHFLLPLPHPFSGGVFCPAHY